MPKKLQEKWDNKAGEELLRAVISLRNTDEARRFLRDLLTEAELVEFSNRFQAAKMLSNNISYLQISKSTGLSSATVARIAKWLNGQLGGYKLIINRLSHSHTVPARSR